MGNHIVITGTGRSGTTFLVELLTCLGLDTGFDQNSITKHSTARAGLEINLLDSVSPPYIVKDPSFALYLSEVLERKDIILDHVFVAMRDLSAAAESRRHVNEMSDIEKYPDGQVPGGLTGTSEGNLQEDVLKTRIFDLLNQISQTDCEITCLHYPLMVENKGYLYKKLKPVLNNIDQDNFNRAFDSVADSQLVNKFSEADVAGNYRQFKGSFQYENGKRNINVSTQLFYNYGKGFSEKESLLKTVSIDTDTIEFSIPTIKRINRIRLDPANEYCSLILGDTYAKKESGDIIQLTPIKTSGYESEGTYYFTDNDPQIYFDVGDAIESVKIDIKYVDIGNTVRVKALPIVEKFLKLQIYKLKKQSKL